VQDANYGQLAIGEQVIDGVGRMEDHAQAWSELLAPGAYERRVQQRRELCLDGAEVLLFATGRMPRLLLVLHQQEDLKERSRHRKSRTRRTWRDG
jgi:hypothetical protein